MREQTEKKHWGLKFLGLLIVIALGTVAVLPFHKTPSTVTTTIPTNVTD